MADVTYADTCTLAQPASAKCLRPVAHRPAHTVGLVRSRRSPWARTVQPSEAGADDTLWRSEREAGRRRQTATNVFSHRHHIHQKIPTNFCHLSVKSRNADKQTKLKYLFKTLS